MQWLWDPKADREVKAIRENRTLLNFAELFNEKCYECPFYTCTPVDAPRGTPKLDLDGREEPAQLKEYYNRVETLMQKMRQEPRSDDSDDDDGDDEEGGDLEPGSDERVSWNPNKRAGKRVTCWVRFVNCHPRAI